VWIADIGAPARVVSTQTSSHHQASSRQTGHLCKPDRNCRLGAATFLSRSKLMIVADQRVGSLGSRSGRSRVGFAALLAAGPRNRSEFDLFGDAQSVVDFNAEIAHGAFQLRMSQQKLNRS